MKNLSAIIFLLSSVIVAFGQSREATRINPQTKPGILTEAEEAFKTFDFGKLVINPNNLTRKNIEDLRNNFYEEVKPHLLDEGESVNRLARIAQPILLFHQAGKSRTIVFNHQRPTVFTWKETFITFSTGAMDILTDDEVAALIAHEIGHLYFAEILAKAREEKNEREARIIELKCDLVALVTLSKLNIKPSNLISAVKKLVQRRSELGIGSFEKGSPSLKNREEILELFISLEKTMIEKASQHFRCNQSINHT